MRGDRLRVSQTSLSSSASVGYQVDQLELLGVIRRAAQGEPGHRPALVARREYRSGGVDLHA